MTADDYEKLVQKTEAMRNAYFAMLGTLDGNWSPVINHRFMDGPAWPTRPGWQRITNGSTTLIASSGLSDPWYESDEVNHGLGIEVLVASNDSLPSDLTQMTGCWLYQSAVAISNAAVDDGKFALRFDRFGPFLFGIPWNDTLDLSSDWVCYDDCVGFLIGLPIPGADLEFSLPGGNAQLLAAKLLTPTEYEYVADNGPEGVAVLGDRFVENNTHHLSSIQRACVISGG